MRLFRVKNKGRFGWWVFADTEFEARQISFDAGRARDIENLVVVGDETEYYRPTTDLDQQTTKGIASLRMPSRQWNVRPT